MESYKKLEKKYSKFVGSKYAVSCNSGTSALHLALLALGIKKGDEVIVPDFAMAAIPFAVSYTGAIPIFGDVDFFTYGLMPHEVERLINKKTKAIIVAHTYGRLAEINKIITIAKKYNIPVIEDAAEAQGAVYKSKADMTCYSFYKNKIINAEEGGIVTMNKLDYYKSVNYYKNMAFGSNHDFFHKHIGYNYRMPNAQAKLALESLECYSDNNKKRRQIEQWYNDFFDIKDDKRDAVWFYDIQLSKKVLKKIPQARDCFKSLSTMPMYDCYNMNLINSKYLSDGLVLLPCDPKLTKKDIINICKKI